jgi:nucleoid DNA-binding protein
MNKAELIDAITEELDLPKTQVEKTINSVLEHIRKGVRDDGSVQLVGFGTFDRKDRKERSGRNPQTGATMVIPASRTCGFKPGKPFKEFLNG